MVPGRLFLDLSFSSTLLLNRETTIKIDKNRGSTDLHYEKGQFHYSYGSKFWKAKSYARPFTVIHENFLFYIFPIYELTNTLKLVDKKKQTPSRTNPQRNFLVWETESKTKLVQQR